MYLAADGKGRVRRRNPVDYLNNDMKKIEKLAPVQSVMYRSPDPEKAFTYSPGICALPSGRLIGTLDMMGPGVSFMEEHASLANGKPLIGKVFVSDDRGKSWKFRKNFGFIFARPFEANGVLYLLGQNGDLMIMKSEDEGDTWSDPVRLTDGACWHQAPCNVWYANGNVYLVMEKMLYRDCHAWEPSVYAPVLMRAALKSDLMCRSSWSFSSTAAFRDLVNREDIHYFAVPFFDVADKEAKIVCEAPTLRKIAPIGWLETNVVQFTDPRHIWCDPSGHTFHLWMRAHTGGTGYAAIMKVTEREDGSMALDYERAPSGKKVVFVPCPGGQMKFHILYDTIGGLFWLLSTQATDSMLRPEMMPPERFDLPNNERQRLTLHFSKNCIDWCFAGLVDAVDSPKMSRSYASMAILGDDLIILSRSGDEQAVSAHNGNMITCHCVENFRDLVY